MHRGAAENAEKREYDIVAFLSLFVVTPAGFVQAKGNVEM
jgi:hypothetical protein